MTVPEYAEALQISISQVRELLRERHVVAARRGENNALYLPAGQLVDGDSGPEVLATVRGTIILLADAGMSDEEIAKWLVTDNDELGESPLAALRSGKRAPVRRAAQSLF